MTAEQVLRCAILKQYRQLTYEELAFYLEDSSSFRGFSRLEMGQYPCKSILQANIKALREETREALHREIIGYAKQEKIESGRKIRIDATAVETDIHHPTDSTLLAEGASSSDSGISLTRVRPETRIFVRDQGMRKKLSQAYI
jgi:IS5 family transposase